MNKAPILKLYHVSNENAPMNKSMNKAMNKAIKKTMKHMNKKNGK